MKTSVLYDAASTDAAGGKHEKLLLLIRHAKSSWNDAAQRDFDRPLNDRGNKDAPAMAKRLIDKNVTIDAFISSPANRALTTAIFFAKAYNISAGTIIQKPELYHAGIPVFYNVIQHADDACNTIAVFSHNPGITEFINDLEIVRLDDMPTCGIIGITVDTGSWKDFKIANKKLSFFDYPKAMQ